MSSTQKNIKKGDTVYTPRFCSVKIQKVFQKRSTAARYGFIEPTHYVDSGYDILGKHTGLNMMVFAAIKKN